MRWNLTKDGSTWIIAEDSINEIGCIHTCQAWNWTTGVITGPDIRFENGRVVTGCHKTFLHGPLHLDKNDAQRRPAGSPATGRPNHQKHLPHPSDLGMKGCYVYFCDQALHDHFAAQPPRPSENLCRFMGNCPLRGPLRCSENPKFLRRGEEAEVNASQNS